MNKNENLKQGQLIIINCHNAMVDLLQQYCERGLNCLCLLKSTSKECLIQKLLLQQAGVNLNIALTKEDYNDLVKAMHDICKWGLYIDRFQTFEESNNKIKQLNPDYVFIEIKRNNTEYNCFKAIAEKQQIGIILVLCNDELIQI